jgi:hypothetical protein
MVVLLVLAVIGVAVPVVLAATPNQMRPGQRLDAKVLLLSADGTEPGFAAWKYELTREGVPFDTVVSYTGAAKTSTLTDARLADYGGAQHAKYDAVILSSGDLGHQVANPDGTTSYLSALTDAEWATLAKFEQTFGVRQLSDYTAPSPTHGLVAVGGASQDGKVGTLTAAGTTLFPYLKGPIPIPNDDPDPAASEAFGYAGTPVDPQNWQTLVSAPGGGAYLGIFTHPDDGREEMVMTVAGNENQSHAQLLRHGMLNWVTRGVFLGYQRNYLELQVDDLFLGDDAWDPATHTTNYDPAAASRMTSGDVARAVSWSGSHNLRLDFAFNGGGSALWQDQTSTTSDPLVGAIQGNASSFGFINHTFDHPNMDCSTAPFITKEVNDNVAWANAHGIPIDKTEVVTGEHSGLANSRPGNPGTIDPPSLDDVEPTDGTGTAGGVPSGTYDYALTARSTAGESTASEVDAVVVGTTGTTGNTVAVTFNAVCHAVTYNLYRRTSSAGAWSLVGSLNRSADAATDDGANPVNLSITDDGATATAGAPPTANGAALAPYGQNPNYLAGLVAAGVGTVATDASKTYPVDPANVAGAQWPLGATFTEGTPPAAGFQAVPRYPSNVYYNVSRQGQQLDEYNWIYVAPANGGGCVAIPQVTTCRTTPATWADYVASENTIMFRHLMGNDPRPHFMHQSNLADYNPALPETDPNQGGVLYPVLDGLLARYDTTIDRAKAPLVQLTSTQVAATLARQNSWEAHLAAGDVTAWLQDGKLHVKNASAAAVEVPLTGTTFGDPYAGQLSGWKTIVAGAEVVLTPEHPLELAPVASGAKPPGAAGGQSGAQGVSGKGTKQGAPVAKLQLTKLSMSPKRFAVAHRRRQRGTRLDGSRITWKLNKRATVRLVFQRQVGSKHHRRWITVGTIRRSAAKGTGVVRFTGRFGAKPMAPRTYRLTVTAKAGRQTSAPKRVQFRVERAR